MGVGSLSARNTDAPQVASSRLVMTPPCRWPVSGLPTSLASKGSDKIATAGL
jgi:hypothetical protein